MRTTVMLKIAVACLILLGASVTHAASTAVRLDQPVANFTLQDCTGQTRSLTAFTDQGVTVLMFISTTCPGSNAYNGRYVQLYKEYVKKGVQFVGINSNAPESVPDIVTHARQHGFQFPILKDNGNVIADRFNAQITPTVYVVDSKGVLRYVGRIDDSPKPAQPRVADLKMALDSLLTGQPVAKKETKAFG